MPLMEDRTQTVFDLAQIHRGDCIRIVRAGDRTARNGFVMSACEEYIRVLYCNVQNNAHSFIDITAADVALGVWTISWTTDFDTVKRYPDPDPEPEPEMAEDNGENSTDNGNGTDNNTVETDDSHTGSSEGNDTDSGEATGDGGENGEGSSDRSDGTESTGNTGSTDGMDDNTDSTDGESAGEGE